jgi:ABC-type transport system involved in cytochrome bd biosynthesis fused ATPase/permease subunit
MRALRMEPRVRGVDRVLVLRDGRIEQDGPPQELLRAEGYFRQMMAGADGAEAASTAHGAPVTASASPE